MFVFVEGGGVCAGIPAGAINLFLVYSARKQNTALHKSYSQNEMFYKKIAFKKWKRHYWCMASWT